MRLILLLLGVLSVSSCIKNQYTVTQYPELKEIVVAEFSNSSNIFPIAILGKGKDRIPVFYSLMHYSTDSSYFGIQGDNIDKYSLKTLNNGQIQPLYKSDALKLPDEYKKYHYALLETWNQAKKKVNVAQLFRFSREPEWWQADETLLDPTLKKYTFIGQIELQSLTNDDCCLYVFYDQKSKITKYIIQRS